MTCSLWKPDASCTRILVSDFSLMRSSLILKLQLFQLPNLLLSWFQDGRTQKFFCGFHVWNGGIIVYWENIHKPKPVWTQFRLCYDQKATYNASHSFGERRKMKLWVEPVFIQLRFSLGESFLVFRVIWVIPIHGLSFLVNAAFSLILSSVSNNSWIKRFFHQQTNENISKTLFHFSTSSCWKECGLPCECLLGRLLNTKIS